MSGFFMIKRELFRKPFTVCGKGFKILLDILSSAKTRSSHRNPLYFSRPTGRRKQTQRFDHPGIRDPVTGQNAWTSNSLPIHPVHIGRLLRSNPASFDSGNPIFRVSRLLLIAQAVASLVAMVLNFTFNNSFTHRDHRLTGRGFSSGSLCFIAVCSVGAFVNVEIATIFTGFQFRGGLAGCWEP